jgi:3-oxoacyl-[acyl-carrier-protein] synthase-1
VSPARDIVVTGVGATTPVGLSAPASCAALRAGVARLGEIETHYVDGELFDLAPVVGGRVPTEWFSGGPVEWDWPGHERFEVSPPPPPEKLVADGPERLAEIAVPAIREAMECAGLSPRSGEVGLFVGIDDAEDPETLERALRPVITPACRVVEMHASGRAAGLLALEDALRALAEDRVGTAIVGGVDSWIRAPVLRRLESAGILRSATNPQGLIPGEAAAFVVLDRIDVARGRGARTLARCLAAATADEPTAGTDDPNQGVGLTTALREAASVAGGFEGPPLVVCDLNGDRYRASEWSMAAIRTLGRLHGDMSLWHPADCIGDPGAASGIVNIVWAVAAFGKRYAPSERALIWGASEGPTRGAAVLAPVAD